ncbi:MAG: anthranilate phosphoribosyltransferase [Desulfobulbaceae bacterium]|nr:MAG: anthranilate phosphoribosyltransferase [Desulfobulbaceae bacterium]
MNIRQAIAAIIDKDNLQEQQMYEVMNEIMSGECTPAQIGSFLTGLRMKGETVEEVTGAVRVMREKVTAIETGIDTESGGIVVDTCGTGGDGSNTFNVSTATSFVAAGCGVVVAKHGNRSVSSTCGSADVLEALGVNLALSAEQVGECIKKIGIGFLFAPALHGAMKHAIGPRKELGIRTIFNILGPLTNPAGANAQVLGVFSKDLTRPLAEVLAKLGSRRALVVHGEGNLDELTVTGETSISELCDGQISSYSLTPEEVGLGRYELTELSGGSNAMEAAEIFKSVLSGEEGARKDMVLLNSAAALLVAEKVTDMVSGVTMAQDCIDSGAAMEKLTELINFSTVIGS